MVYNWYQFAECQFAVILNSICFIKSTCEMFITCFSQSCGRCAFILLACFVAVYLAGYETFNETADFDEAVTGKQSGDQSTQRVSSVFKRLREAGHKLNSYYTNIRNINSVDDSIAAGLFIRLFQLEGLS